MARMAEAAFWDEVMHDLMELEARITDWIALCPVDDPTIPPLLLIGVILLARERRDAAIVREWEQRARGMKGVNDGTHDHGH